MNKLPFKHFPFLSAVVSVALFAACSHKNDAQIPVFTGDAGDLKPFTEITLPVIRRGASAGSVKVRYYEDLPSIPYISAAEFQALMLPGSTMSVSWKGDGYELTNAYSTATVNTVEERMSCKDYIAFTNLMDQVQKGMPNAYLDGYPYVRFAYQETTAPAPVDFEFGNYGIDLRGDGSAVYFPFATLADMYADTYFHYAVCNGEKVIVADRDSDDNAIDVQEPAYAINNLLSGTRAEDMTAYNYGELCFVIDHFYGMPGRSPYEASIGTIGLDKTLEASAEGKQIKSMLLSSSMMDMVAGMDFLAIYLYDGGHTKTWKGDIGVLSDPFIAYQTNYPELLTLYAQSCFRQEIVKTITYVDLLQPERNAIFPDGATYHKKGDTAICHFDKFSGVDYVAWNAFYAGTGPLPTMETVTRPDMMVIFLDALKKADEDPEVKNLVIDLTQNRGGSLDLVVAMTSLMYGESIGRVENTLTGERVVWHYDVDRNFDGKFDEKDKEVRYDLNFCLLTSHFSFSCGNMFPSLCKDAGILVAGETCGGGSCAVGAYRTAEGFPYQISSARGRLSDKNWGNIDSGVVPNVSIETGPYLIGYWNGNPIPMPSLAPFFDLDNLSGIIKEYYK